MNTSSSTVESGGAPQRIDVAIVGAGFGGMYAVYKFREMGLKIQGFEAGGDVGGARGVELALAVGAGRGVVSVKRVPGDAR